MCLRYYFYFFNFPLVVVGTWVIIARLFWNRKFVKMYKKGKSAAERPIRMFSISRISRSRPPSFPPTQSHLNRTEFRAHRPTVEMKRVAKWRSARGPIQNRLTSYNMIKSYERRRQRRIKRWYRLLFIQTRSSESAATSPPFSISFFLPLPEITSPNCPSLYEFSTSFENRYGRKLSQ